MKRAVIILVILFILASLPGVSGAGTVYFAAINNEVLPLDIKYMPYMAGDELYVPTTMLTYTSNVINVAYSKVTQTLVLLYSQKQLVFDLRSNLAYDDKQQYNEYAIQSGSLFYVPAEFVFNYFGYDYSPAIETPYGKICRLKTKQVYSDGTFVGAMDYTLKKYYDEYMGNSPPPASSSRPSAPPPSPIREAYLTFDDGPYKSVTSDILDVLDNYNVKATFFVQGSSIERNASYSADMLRRMIGSGHAVGNHGFSHVTELFYASPESVIDELNRTNDLLYEACMYRTRIARMPGGSSPKLTKDMQDALAFEGYRFWDWNIDPGDSIGNPSASKIASRTIEKLKEMTDRPAIILLHDKAETLKALPEILDHLKKEQYVMHVITGYELPVNQYKNVN